MITKFVNETGRIVFSQTKESLQSFDCAVGSSVVITGKYYVVQSRHLEVNDSSTVRIISVKEA